jgi:YD repeat-containing protein
MLFKTTVFCVVLFTSFATLAASTPATKTSSQQVASKTYDAKGKLVQRTTAQGRHYNARGQYIGKTTQQGRHYDAKGRYTGKTITTTRGTRTVDAKGKTVRQTKTPR